MSRPPERLLLLREDKQQVVTNGYPYLRIDSIAGCTVKDLDVRVLSLLPIFRHLRDGLQNLFIFVKRKVNLYYKIHT